MELAIRLRLKKFDKHRKISPILCRECRYTVQNQNNHSDVHHVKLHRFFECYLLSAFKNHVIHMVYYMSIHG